MPEKTAEEKYEITHKAMMVIERIALSILVGHIPREAAPTVVREISNIAHVVNHENGEVTFDCGPDREQHHADALTELDRMYREMLRDIEGGTDYSQLIDGSTKARRGITEVADEIEVPTF